MNESSWAHAGILAAFLAVIVPIWLDLRHQHRVAAKESMETRQETEKRLTAIETMLKPLWAWFTKTNGS